jgi:hypothetical protein
MATTFNFEELDSTTRGYLIAVRDGRGAGSPGLFVETSDALPGCGFIAGPIVVVVTLLCTLTTWLDVIYDDPIRVAMLQTAGLLVGGWLLVAGFRGANKGNDKVAGTWVYVDPLHLYEAFRESVTITPVEEVEEAHFTHNYNNGNYQNSVVRVSMGRNQVTTVTLPNESRAEQVVVYLNYLAWARENGGAELTDLEPAVLGGVARYVAKNDHEPRDGEGRLNLQMIELELTEVPDEPTREGRSVPGILPYVVMVVAAAVMFFFLAYVVNPPLRDEAIFDAVTRRTTPPTIEPRFLRAYLTDPRNTMHRDEVTKLLSDFYEEPIRHVRQNGKDLEMRDGLARLLDSVRTAGQPVVSLRVKEENTPAGLEAGRAARESDLRTQFVNKLNDELSRPQWGQAIKPPDGVQFKEQPPPIGQQLLAFIEAPEDAKGAHVEITYTVEKAESGQYRLAVRCDIRTGVEEPPIDTTTFAMPDTFELTDLGTQVNKIKDELVVRMMGTTQNPGALPPPFVPVLPPNP